MEVQRASFALTGLMPDLLDAILSFDDTKHLSRHLWLCGNRLLQHQLANGVTQVALECRAEFGFCRFPMYLVKLRKLRELSLKRHGNRLLFSDATFGTVFRLAPTLRKLKLDYFNSHLAVLPERALNLLSTFGDEDDLVDLPSTDLPPQHSIKSAFPCLDTLEIRGKTDWTTEDLLDLPSTLTHLGSIIQTDANDFVALMKDIPPQLQVLHVSQVPIPQRDFIDLISHFALTELSWGYEFESLKDETLISKLPRTLTTLNSSAGTTLVSSPLTLAGLKSLPPHLTRLGLMRTEGEFEDFSVQHLPHLTSFGEQAYAPRLSLASIKSLPDRIRSMDVAVGLKGCVDTDWPADLTSLGWLPVDAISLKKSPKSFVLPPRLTRLSIWNVNCKLSVDSFLLLPRTLKSLHCDCVKITSSIDLPPALEHLRLASPAPSWTEFDGARVTVNHSAYVSRDLWMSSVDLPKSEEVPFDETLESHVESLERPTVVTTFPFHCVPATVTFLSIDCILPASRLVHLPIRLSTLIVKDIVEDADFHPQSPETLARIAQLAEFSRMEGLEAPGARAEQNDSAPSAECSVASLLPRSLALIQTNSGAMWKECDWRRLPPRLKRLVVTRSRRFIDANIFLSARFPNFIVMSLPLVNFTDEIVKAMPRSLRSIHCRSVTLLRAGLTEDGILHWPTELYWYGMESNLISAFNRLNQKRRDAYASSDLDLIRKLFPRGTFPVLEQ